jgi:hypothetical protein
LLCGMKRYVLQSGDVCKKRGFKNAK